MKLKFYVKDVIHGTTTGFWKIRLDIPGVDGVKLSNESSAPIATPIARPPKDYSPIIPVEMYDRGHIFRLCDRIGKLLCEVSADGLDNSSADVLLTTQTNKSQGITRSCQRKLN